MVTPTYTMRLANHAHDIDADGHDTKGGWHRPARAATTANITIATALNSGDTIDGVTLATGDRVLVKDQSADEQNGIYIAGATPTRAEDADASDELIGGHVYVIAGTANGGKIFGNTNTSAVTVDTDPITYDELATGGTGSLTVEEDGGTPTVTNVDHIVFASSGDATVDVVDDGGGQVTVTVDATAGGAATDDTIPSGGTLYNGTSTSGWTSFGSPDTFDADTTVPGAFYLDKTTMGTNNLVGVYRAVGSFPKTYTMRVKDGRFHENFHGINLLLAESSPGKYWTFGIVRDGGNRYLQRYAWTTASSSGASVNYPTTVDVVANPAIWLRVVVNSSTDVEYWMSFNGYIYYQYAAAQNPAFTIGNFGFGMYTFAAIRHTIAIDWIHES